MMRLVRRRAANTLAAMLAVGIHMGWSCIDLITITFLLVCGVVMMFSEAVYLC